MINMHRADTTTIRRDARTATARVDAGLALDLLTVAAAEKHDLVSSDGAHRVTRRDAGHRSWCLACSALVRAGVGAAADDVCFAQSLRDMWMDQQLPVPMTLGAVLIFHRARAAQRHGQNWRAALVAANAAAESLDALLPGAALRSVNIWQSDRGMR